MRLDPSAGETAAGLLNRLSEAELAHLLFEYGEEHHARRIARVIVRRRPSTGPVTWSPPSAPRAPRGVAATPARRHEDVSRPSGLAVNDEPGALRQALTQAPRLLEVVVGWVSSRFIRAKIAS